MSYLCHSLGDGSVCASTILGLWANLLGLVPEKEVVDLLCGLKKGKATQDKGVPAASGPVATEGSAVAIAAKGKTVIKINSD